VTPLERLLTEAWPDGTFGGPRDCEFVQHQAPPRRPVTAEEAATHVADLLAALDEKPERHLRAVPPAA
jgi:hypothetical protein